MRERERERQKPVFAHENYSANEAYNLATSLIKSMQKAKYEWKH